jgi:mannose-1-phosphate guanylyltransferase
VREIFANCPTVAIAVAVAVLEKTDRDSALPLDAVWSDVSSWSALGKPPTRTGRATCSADGCPLTMPAPATCAVNTAPT